MTERLNEAFGHGRWEIAEQVITVTEARMETRTNKGGTEYEVQIMRMVVMRVTMRLLDYPWFQAWSYGGNDNADLGDAYKGAVSDAVSKICAVHFHVALDVYTGLPPDRGPQKTKEQIQAEAKAKVEVIKAQLLKAQRYHLQSDFMAQLEAYTRVEQTPDVSAGRRTQPRERNDCFDPEKCITKKQAGLFWLHATKNHSAEDVKRALNFKGLSSIYKCPKEPRTIFDSLLKWAQKQ